jgi:hypothetical protein
MDKKRLIGEEAPTITQGDIDAWNRGKDDAARNKLLQINRALSPDAAVRLIKRYAATGDLHALLTRFDVTMSEARRILAAFGITSIEDAKAAVRDGIVAALDDAKTAAQEDSEAQRRIDHKAAQRRLNEQEQAMAPAVKTTEETDTDLAQRREEADRLNKADKIRQLISEGIDPDTNTSDFRINIQDIVAFRKMVPYGVSYLQRRFGGTAKDIVEEVKRLLPSMDTNMLRP